MESSSVVFQYCCWIVVFWESHFPLFFLAAFTAYGNSLARDWTSTTAMTPADAVSAGSLTRCSTRWLLFFCLFVFVLSFWGCTPGMWKFPGYTRVGSELHLWPYTTSHGNTRSLTPWARPEIKPASSWILIRFITTEPQQELLGESSLNFLSFPYFLQFFFNFSP